MNTSYKIDIKHNFPFAKEPYIEFETDKIDTITQSTFKELIAKNLEEHDFYIIGLTLNKLGTFQINDGQGIYKWIEATKRTIYNEPCLEVVYFLIEKVNGIAEEIFQKIGIHSEIQKNKNLAYLRLNFDPSNENSFHSLAEFYYKEKNYKQAFTICEKGAHLGYASLEHNLGTLYLYGLGVEKNPEKGLNWINKSAQKGYVDSQMLLAHQYISGINIEQDFEKAFKLYSSAAEKGLALAQFWTGNCYLQGMGVPTDREKAKLLMNQAAAQGNLEAKYHLAKLSFDTDKELALKLLKEAAENGSLQAKKELAKRYSYGNRGVEQNSAEGIKWFYSAIDQGDLTSKYKLALFYLNSSTNQNISLGIQLLKEAANQGLFRAQKCLAQFYLYGLHVNKNLKKATFWYEKMSAQGNEKALFNLSYCYEKGLGVEKNIETAVSCYDKFADENPYALNNLAYFYLTGLGKPKNIKKAHKLLTIAEEDICSEVNISSNNLKKFFITKEQVNEKTLKDIDLLYERYIDPQLIKEFEQQIIGKKRPLTEKKEPKAKLSK